MNRVRGLSCRALLGTASAGAIVALLTMPGADADAAAGAQDRRSARGAEHAARRSQRSAGAHRLPADHLQAGRALHRLCRSPRRQQGEPGAAQRAHRPGRAQRHVDPRRDRSQAAEISRAHSGRGRRRRGRRVADDARVRRQDARQGRSQPGLSAAHLRPRGPRDVGGHRSDPAEGAVASSRHDRHPQELLGMRGRRHRLHRVAAERLARAHHRGLRPQRSVQSGQDPRLRAARPAAGRKRRRPGDRPRHGVDRREGQPHLHGLRHQPRRPAADPRPREAAEGTEGADA